MYEVTFYTCSQLFRALSLTATLSFVHGFKRPPIEHATFVKVLTLPSPCPLQCPTHLNMTSATPGVHNTVRVHVIVRFIVGQTMVKFLTRISLACP